MVARKAAAAAALLLIACGGGGAPAQTHVDMAAGNGGAPPAVPVGQKPPEGPPAHTVGGFGITLPPVVLAAGEESYPCYLFPLEVMGPSRAVGAAVLRNSLGLHHGNITTVPSDGDDSVHPCPDDEYGSEAIDVARGGAVLFGSSTQFRGSEEWQHFPDGMGYRIPDGQQIAAHMHYLNAATSPVTVSPVYEWFTIDESSLRQELTPFAFWMTHFQIPPYAITTVSADCTLPDPRMHIVTVLPHMHNLGRALFARFLGGPLDGTPFLSSPGYDPDNGVMLQYDPAVDLSQGDGFTFGCTWDNESGDTVVEGFGQNEMCILFGYSYPKQTAYSVIASAAGSCSAILPR